MADPKARGHLSVTPPIEISKDAPGLDGSIPLSPQWLIPKQGESKAGMAPVENHSSMYPSYHNSGAGKSQGNGENMHDSHKKKDVYRPTFLGMESARRDRWHDEERDTSMSIRRDRWREGDKELGETRKMDRWADNSSGKHFGEARRPSSERWTDMSRDNAFDQRRESKWNTRWGPDDKKMDKWSDSGKHGDASHDKGLSHVMNHGKDEREGDHYRPWRPNSSLSRAKADPPHYQSQMAGKDINSFGHGRGHGDSTAPTFSLGRSKVSLSTNSVRNVSTPTQSLSSVSGKGDNGHGEPSPFSYSKTKLLDLYGVTDMRLVHKLLDDFPQVPSLTHEELLEPFALSASTSEELAILRGIDKGDIISSGVTQVSKDASAGQGLSDLMQTRRTRTGSRDDVSLHVDDPNDNADDSKDAYSNFRRGFPHERRLPVYGSDPKLELMENEQKYADTKHNIEDLRVEGASFSKANDTSKNRDPNIHDNVLAPSSIAWKSSVGELAHSSACEWSDVHAEVLGRNSEISWSQAQKELRTQSVLANKSYPQNELNWQMSNDTGNRRQTSLIIDRELEARKLLQPSPEDLILYYKDPQGLIQGPFSGGDIIGWFDAGYFGIDLPVRLASAPADCPFSLLGDVMPHLRAKVRPPPGFSAAKLNEIPDMSTGSSLSNYGKVLAGASGVDLIGIEQRYAHGSSTEAENRFLESLMSNSVSSSSLDRFSTTEGLQGYPGHNLSSLHPLGVESGDSHNILAKRLTLEWQRSMSNSYPNWPTKDAAFTIPHSEILQEPSISQPKVLSSTNDLPHHPSQNVDMMSVLQGLHDRSNVVVNNGVGGWSGFPVQGGSDSFKDKVDLHHNQNFPPQVAMGLQQHRVRPQNHPYVANILGQSLDSPSILASEKFISSGLAQDPQVLNLLHQQYLLQMQSQAPLTTQQLSMLDKIMLLKQQQKQEEQLRQQQQQLFSQVLTNQHQRFVEPSYGQLQADGASVMTAGNVPDHLDSMMPQSGYQPAISTLQEDKIINLANAPVPIQQDMGYTVGLETSLHLPHEIFETHKKSWATSTVQHEDISLNDPSVVAAPVENLLISEAMETSKDDSASRELVTPTSTEEASQIDMTSDQVVSATACEVPGDFIASETIEISHGKLAQGTDGLETLVTKEGTDSKGLPATGLDINEEKSSNVVSAVKEPKHVEVCDARKTSEKKSRKQKSSKVQSSAEQAKGVKKSSSQQLKRTETGHADSQDAKLQVSVSAASEGSIREMTDAQKLDNMSRSLSKSDIDLVEVKDEVKSMESVEQHGTLGNSVQRAWKPAVVVKPKSLLEIQQEEERKAHTEIAVSAIITSVSTNSLSSPWAGVVASSEPKMSQEVHLDVNDTEISIGKSENSKAKKSQLHDLLAAEVLAKSSEKETEIPDAGYGLVPSSQTESVGDDFIEAKDTKKSRKKAGKAKSAGTKSSALVSSAEVIVSSSPIEKTKSSRQVQQERDVLPAPPQGPSLGDFVPWKGESISPSAAPAWSTGSGKLPAASLRDILKEQEKKGSSTQQQLQLTTKKSHSSQVSHTNSWSLSGTSPSKAAYPIQSHSHVPSQTKHKVEDDLFWGPPDQSKQEIKPRIDFPQLGNQSNWSTKSTPVKSSSGASLSRQKSAGGKAVEILLSAASAQLPLKGKGDGTRKRSEAMEFRDWCESESFRLTGSKDTSFLEFCLKQSRSEAEILLTQNLGRFDPNHEFIDKFLNYMDMVSADVLEIAFQGQNGYKATAYGARDMTSDYISMGDIDIASAGDGSAKGGKKKGKKGKKVSPSVLGFNVVSNRIMMGEIQSVED